MQRLSDFGKTASSKLTVDEFNKIDLEEEADPPSFTKARQRAKQAQIYDESAKYASPELLAQLASTQERVEAVLAKRKIIEDDIANRATVLPSPEERRKMIKSRLPVRALNYMDDNVLKDLGAYKGEGGISEEITSNDESNSCSFSTSHLKASTGDSDSNEIENVSQKEVREKELLDVIAMFNETQQDFEDEADTEDSKQDNGDNSCDGIEGDEKSKQNGEQETTEDKLKNEGRCFLSY